MGTMEIVFIFVIYLLLFGAKGIPSLAQTMGKAVRQFREASSDIQREIMNTSNDIRNEVNKEVNKVNQDPLRRQPEDGPPKNDPPPKNDAPSDDSSKDTEK
jgi:sec-independent protein translocase protein TatA